MGARYLLWVYVYLDELGPLGEPLDLVLGYRPKDREPSAKGKHHVSLREQLHSRLGSHVSYRPNREMVAGREGIVVQVRGSYRCAQVLGNLLYGIVGVGIYHALAGYDNRGVGTGEQLYCSAQRLLRAPVFHVSSVLVRLKNLLL